jgi:hypothetical protein
MFILLVVNYFTTYAQNDETFCAFEDQMTLKSAELTFIDISNEPIKHVRTNFIFLRKDNGTGGFQPNNTEHQQYINDMISNLNSIYSNIPSGYDPVCYNGVYGVLGDSKIRFDVNVMYIDDTYNWNNENSIGSYFPFCPGYQGYHLTNLNNQIAQNNPESALNVFFTEDGSAYEDIVSNQNCPYTNLPFDYISCSESPNHNNFNINQSVHLRNVYIKYYWMMNCVVDNVCNNPEWINDPPTWTEAYSWLSVGRLQAHELAHSFGIGHVSHNDCSNCMDYLMNNKGCSWGNFLSPKDIGLMHHALSHTSARKYVPADTYSNTPISITQNTTWTDNSRIYRGINIQSGSQLHLTTELIIPSQVDILLQGTSSFVASEANIHTPSATSTLDLIVQQNSSVSLTNSTVENCNISIQSGALTLNNAIIDISNSGSFTISLGSTLTFNSGTIQ